MVSQDTVRKLALAYPETDEAPHHEVTSFRVKQKIFLTMNQPENRCCVRLSAEDQSLFALYDASVVWPVPNAWGKYGWTLVNLKKVKKEMLTELLRLAYCQVAPKKLAERFRMEG